MKVVIAHVQFSLYWFARIRLLYKTLRRDGIDLTVVEVTASRGADGHDPATDVGDIPWVRLFEDADPHSLPPAEMFRRLWLAFEELQPDVILAVAIAFPPGAAAVKWCRTRRRGVVILDDAREADVPRSAVVNFVKRRIYANVDAMLVPAASHLSSCQRFGIRADRVFYGVDVIDNQWIEQNVAKYRSAGCFAVSGRELPSRFFLGAGRQVQKKNWPQLLRAFAEYRERSTDSEMWDLVLVGGGPEEPKLRAEIEALRLTGVHIFPFVSQQEICVFYAAAGCLVLPSFYGETWGLVVNEALAAGLPVLVSRECGCAQTLVWERKNGFTFSPYSASELAGLLGRIASLTGAERAQLGHRSERIIADWTLDRFVQGACSAIDKARDGHRGFAGLLDRLIISLWKGRYRPT